jgi:regulator of protease activity HflC (stomatin/prohibitin superfamily)
MSENAEQKNKELKSEEIILKAKSGMFFLLLNIILMLVSVALIIVGAIWMEAGEHMVLAVTLFVAAIIYICIIGPILLAGLKVLRPNEAYVLTLFGRYYGTLKGAGFYFVNPFVTAVNPAGSPILVTGETGTGKAPTGKNTAAALRSKKISLKAMTLSNDKQKINDQLGNPIIIGIVVIWRVINTAKAVFNVDNYEEFLSIQCDSALRNIVRLYPYDVAGDDNEKTLRGSSQEIAEKIKLEIQGKVDIAGLEIQEARITHLSYAPEIAAAMLQRQQASAIIDARQMIVEGAVGMVEMALSKLNDNNIVVLDEERKAAMVSNLLVVLCGNKDAQPVVNSGSLY